MKPQPRTILQLDEGIITIEELRQEYLPQINNICNAYGLPDEAKTISEIAFDRLSRMSDHIDTILKVQAFLLKVTHDQCRACLSKREREMLVNELSHAILLEIGWSPTDEMVKLFNDHISEAIDTIKPAVSREVYSSFYFEKMSLREIATSLEISLVSVYAFYKDADQHVKNYLKLRVTPKS